MMKILFRVFIAVLAVFLVAKVQKVKGRFLNSFSVNRTYTNLQWHIDVKEESSEKILPILQQKFYFLGKGAQVYAFESSDHKYVLKLLKQSYFRKPIWKRSFHNISEYDNKTKTQLLKVLNHFKLSYAQAQKETAMLFMHLNRSANQFGKVEVVDRAGRVFKIDLDNTVFMVQKKATPLLVVFKELEKKRDFNTFNEILQKCIKVELQLMQNGIRDGDSNVRNLAVLDGEVIKIDGGIFWPLEKERSKKEILWTNTAKMRLYLKKHDPELLKRFEAMLNAETI